MAYILISIAFVPSFVSLLCHSVRKRNINVTGLTVNRQTNPPWNDKPRLAAYDRKIEKDT